MTRRLRIAHLVVQTVLVWDDGDELAPGPQVQPITVPLSKLGDFAASLPADVARLAAQPEEQGDGSDQVMRT